VASARGRKRGDESHENEERWLITYADMITLLMAFFLMLYSMSVLNIAKFRDLAISVRSEFGTAAMAGGLGVMPGNGTDTDTPPPVAPQGGKVDLVQAMGKMQEFIEKEGLQGEVEATIDERGLVFTILTDKALFARGSADLTEDTKRVVAEIGKLIKDMPNPVVVEGHTCDLPIRTAAFPSNWELSTARATNVLRYLGEHAGIGKSRLSASGYADSRPRLPNASEHNRSKNRRVEIVVVGQSKEPFEPVIPGLGS
jgi:chemotaxis protein MotB